MSIKRIQRELDQFLNDQTYNYKGGPVEDDILHWHVTIVGPDNSPYAQGIFLLDVKFPTDYPFKPPKVAFITKVYHPNINQQGKADIDILNQCWSPALTISTVLRNIITLLFHPNPSTPMIPEIATQYKQNIQKFEKTARQWTKNYASEKKE